MIRERVAFLQYNYVNVIKDESQGINKVNVLNTLSTFSKTNILVLYHAHRILNIKVMDVNVLDTHKQRRINVYMKYGYLFYKTIDK